MRPIVHVEVVKALRAPVTPRFLRTVLTEAVLEPSVAARLGDGEYAVALRVTGDRELHRLNRQFLGEDRPTDVLSFPAGGWPPEGGYLGDLALSWPAVERQAAAFGHQPALEAALLAVHGLLHLLGWDHADAVTEREMTGLTLACLARAGLAPSAGRL